ncbi:baseplate J/gp47 family protein [Desulfocurvibacter africanus]|uniref:Baseplate J family protein n=1 Tax=Desulfocurvibacter africanus subsp. africanus str. Walvis Bay TaxID=690850 RepID=F3Z2U2_DESAF|nr:baseplate J/gp47 family protein [Desulfocurvibacter africanus]EGJ50259.1 Baseplate J family protein [Desulfocurvibacter africanus subsp. africanus str. Walvis Bay]
MAWVRPTLKDISGRIEADMIDRLLGGGKLLRSSVAVVLSRVMAGAVHLLYGYLGWQARQLMPDTAESEHLERWAGIWGVTRKAAAFATGLVTFSGADGASIPVGTELQRADGTAYTVTEGASVSGGSATVQVEALEPGAAGNAEAGEALSLVSPLSGVQSSGVVAASGLSGGADTESDDALRARLLARLRRTPQGGSADDYAAWALAVPGVTRCWVSPGEMGAGAVSVRVMLDNSYPDGIPQSGDLEAVSAAIEAVRPVTADVYVLAPIPLPVPIDVRITPDTPAIRAAVQAELAALFAREGQPGGMILRTHISEAVSLAAGERDHVLLAPAVDVEPGPGELATLGAITWED